ncbi:hypothetical protein Fot_01351 [Forsythia ovata]|uniref:Uncharacterized protein n=1 Tax=Forsythia ovata TaxID=205694 RepID=A0ABD1X3Q3_9LAMI
MGKKNCGLSAAKKGSSTVPNSGHCQLLVTEFAVPRSKSGLNEFWDDLCKENPVEKGSVVPPDVQKSRTEKQPDVQDSGTEKQPDVAVPTPMAKNQGRTCVFWRGRSFCFSGQKT